MSVRPVLPSLQAHSVQLLTAITVWKKKSVYASAPWSGRVWGIVGIEARLPGQHGPRGTRVLVRQGERPQCSFPVASGPPPPIGCGVVRTSCRGAQRRPRAMDAQTAWIPVAALTDPKQPRTPPCGTLPRHNAQPRSELAAVAKLRGVADRCNQRHCRQNADAGNRNQPFARRQLLSRGAKLCVK